MIVSNRSCNSLRIASSSMSLISRRVRTLHDDNARAYALLYIDSQRRHHTHFLSRCALSFENASRVNVTSCACDTHVSFVHDFALLFLISLRVARYVLINCSIVICDTRIFDMLYSFRRCYIHTQFFVYACIVICICVHFVNTMYEKCKHAFVNFL